MNIGGESEASEPRKAVSRAALMTPEQRQNYYRTLRRAISLRDLAKRLLGDRITREGEGELLVDCPRHASQSGRSLRIDLHQGVWFCFGCEKGGDGLQLVEFVEHDVVTKGVHAGSSPTHRAARDRLAELAGFPRLADAGLTEEEIAAIERKRAEAEAVFHALTEVTEHYHKSLLERPDVMEWVEKQWGFTREIVERFKFGWADEKVSATTLNEPGISDELLLATGAFRKDKLGRLWPFFQKRVVIPYFRAGFVAYLIGRRTPWTDDSEYERSKYKKLPRHDPEKHPEVSPAIDNGVLFGEEILCDRPKRVVITEGIADCIAAQAAGFAAISPVTVHVRREDFDRVVEGLRAVESVCVLFDHEVSGIGHQAALDLARDLASAGVRCRVGELPLAPKQVAARQSLAAFLGADEMARVLRSPPSSRAKEIEALVASKKLDQLAVDALIADAKVDVAEWFKGGGTPEAFEAILDTATDHVTAQIERFDWRDDEAGRRALGRILADIAASSALDQDRQLKSLKAKTGLTLDILRKEMRPHAREAKEAERQQAMERETDRREHPYRATERGLVEVVLTRAGEVECLLSNFTAVIAAEVTHDDGEETQKFFEIEALVDGKPKRAEVSAAKYPAMNWVTEKLGGRAILCAGNSAKDGARAAIQFLSPKPQQRTLYVHTGWRQIDGKWLYLHAGGAIGADGSVPGIDVGLALSFVHYLLPAPPARDEIPHLIRKTLELLEVSSAAIAFVLLAAVFRVLIAPVDFAIQLVGPTGSLKTALLAVIQSFFGAGWAERNLPGSWTSTINALEVQAFTAKDALFVVDDFVPGGGQLDVRRMHKDAERLFRAQGNRAGRGRLRPDSSMRPTRSPRGQVVSSGEDVAGGQSARSRCVVIETKKGEIDSGRLASAQAHAAQGTYARVTAAFVQWIAARLDDERESLQKRVIELRGELRKNGGHLRTPSNFAELRAAFEVFLRFAIDVGAIDENQSKLLLERCVGALETAASDQVEHLEDTDPTRAFFRLLSSAISSGTAFVASENGSIPTQRPEALGWTGSEGTPRGACVGWTNGENLYLDYTSAYKAAQSMAGDTDRLAVTSNTLLKRLADRGHLVSRESKRSRHTIRRTLQGERREVAHVRMSSLFDSNESSADREQARAEECESDANPTSEGKRATALPFAASTESRNHVDELDHELRGIVDLFPLTAAQRATSLATLTTWEQRYREHIAIGVAEGKAQFEAEAQARGIVIGAFREEIGILLIDAGASGKGAPDA